MTTHCQVCAREIKAGRGTIAKHGYKRPGQGWQTASCFGAGHKPYEVGHDALDRWIGRLNIDIPATTARVATLIATPPETYTYQRRDAYGSKRGEPLTFSLPEDFNAAAEVARGSHRPDTYAAHFAAQVRTLRADIAGMREALAYATDRRARWMAPAEAA